MYFNMFGGSALLHLLAGYPRVVAAFGIAATVGMLLSPLGPGQYGGTRGYLQALNRAIKQNPAEARALAQSKRAAELLARTDPQTRHEAVRHALKVCGVHCVELTPAIVERDQSLLNDALLLFVLDREAPTSSSTAVVSAGR